MSSTRMTNQNSARTGILTVDLLMSAVALAATIFFVVSHYMTFTNGSTLDREQTWDLIKQCVLIGVLGVALVASGLAFGWYLMINY